MLYKVLPPNRPYHELALLHKSFFTLRLADLCAAFASWLATLRFTYAKATHKISLSRDVYPALLFMQQHLTNCLPACSRKKTPLG